MIALQRATVLRVTKLAYTAGSIFLLAGLVLSFVSQPVAANTQPERVSGQEDPSGTDEIVPVISEEQTEEKQAAAQPTKKAKEPKKQDKKPGLKFNDGDKGVCKPEAGWVDATVHISLPEGATAKLQGSWHIVQPTKSEIKYIDAGEVKDGDSFTISAYWPGVRPGDKVVEIHWGAALLDIQSSGVETTAGMDYYWYPHVCDVAAADPTPTHVQPTLTATPVEVTPTPGKTATPARPTPGGKPRATEIPVSAPDEPVSGEQLPTLAPPLDRSQDRYVVLPQTGADLTTAANIPNQTALQSFFLNIGMMLIGFGLVLTGVQRKSN